MRGLRVVPLPGRRVFLHGQARRYTSIYLFSLSWRLSFATVTSSSSSSCGVGIHACGPAWTMWCSGCLAYQGMCPDATAMSLATRACVSLAMQRLEEKDAGAGVWQAATAATHESARHSVPRRWTRPAPNAAVQHTVERTYHLSLLCCDPPVAPCGALVLRANAACSAIRLPCCQSKPSQRTPSAKQTNASSRVVGCRAP